jgi:hypothetical protein
VQSVLDHRPSGTHVVLAGHRCAPLRCRLDGCRFGVYLGRCGLDDPIYTPTLAYYRKIRSGQPAANFRLRTPAASVAHYEARIAELEDKLARVEIVDASKFSGDTILSARSDQFIEPLRGLL